MSKKELIYDSTEKVPRPKRYASREVNSMEGIA